VYPKTAATLAVVGIVKGDTMSTQATLTRHLQAILQADVDAIMADYTDASVLVTESRAV
jgi:hypothetical protein